MGSPKSDKVALTAMRKRWRSWGMDDYEIAACSAQVRERQALKRRGELDLAAPLCTRAEYVRLLRRQPHATASGAAVLRLGDDYETPDDRAFIPTQHDSLLTGVARATGATARAVKSRKTITKHQYDAMAQP